jgi:hypothetical protein
MGNKITMKMYKSRNVLALLACIVTLAFSNAPVFAASTSSPSGTTQELRVSPLRTDLTVSPGSTGVVKVDLTNLSSSPVTVQPIENDFVSGGEEGQPALILSPDSYAPSHSLKRFMVPLQNITLQPKAITPVTVSISVPKSAQAGGYFGAIRFSPVTGGASGSAAVGLGESVASLILMTVPGPTYEQLTMTNFDIQQNGSTATNFRTPDNLSLFVRFENKGNLQEAPFGQVYIQKGKKIVYTYNFNQQQPKDEILPDGFRRWTIPLKGMGKFGKYTVGATFAYGSQGQSIDITKNIWIIPTGYIIGAIVIIIVFVLLIGGGYLFLKSYKRKILKSSRRRY